MRALLLSLALISLSVHASEPVRETDSKLTPEEIQILRNSHREKPQPVRSGETSEERIQNAARILEIGEITPGQYIGGGIVGSVVGFGTGHAIQGRYLEDGWIFTVLEGSLIGIGAAANDFSPGIFGGGKIGVQGVTLFLLMGVRVWQIIDVWGMPPSHNRKFRDLKEQMAGPKTTLHILPGVMGNAGGVTALLTF